jgi:predicted Zn-dependent peptidase
LTAIREILDITRGVTREAIREEELAGATEALTNQFVFWFDTPRRIVEIAMDLDFYGYPEDFLDHYMERLGGVAQEDVLEVARKYLRPEEMVILVVGDRSRFEGDLSDFGEVEELELEAMN